MSGVISDDEAIKVLDYIVKYAPLYAKAKAERVYMQEFRKTKKALLYLKTEDGTISERDAYARSHKEYIEVLDGLKEATELEEKYRWYLVAAQAKLEVFRTISANNRRAIQ